MVDVIRRDRTIPAGLAMREHDALNAMFREQLEREDYRHRVVMDVGTGSGRVVWAIAARAHKVIGVDIDERRLQEARAYAAIRGFTRVDFILGDVEKTQWSDWYRPPFDFVLANLVMSEAIVFRASKHLRPDGKLILCAHHTDHWAETGVGSHHAFGEDEVNDLLIARDFEVEFLGVDKTIVACENLLEAERVLGPPLVKRWVEDGRWEGLADSFAKGTRQITLSYVIAKARKLAHGPTET